MLSVFLFFFNTLCNPSPIKTLYSHILADVKKLNLKRKNVKVNKVRTLEIVCV